MKKIPEDEICANCGTDLNWWILQPRSKVYRLPSDEYFCSKKCIREHNLDVDFEN